MWNMRFLRQRWWRFPSPRIWRRCILAYRYQRFRQDCRLHLQSSPRTLSSVGNGYYVRNRQAGYMPAFLISAVCRGEATVSHPGSLNLGEWIPVPTEEEMRSTPQPPWTRRRKKIPPSLGNPRAGNQLLLAEISNLSLARPRGWRFITRHILEVQNHQIIHTSPSPANFELQKPNDKERQTEFQVTVCAAFHRNCDCNFQ